VPYSLDGGTPIGMDDGFRFYRYEAGQRFNAHKDGVVVRSPLIRSRLTCLFYLNEDFEGGETVYYAPDRVDGVRPVVASVIPQTGMAVIFQHEWWHEGRGVRTGRKYVLRSDVFYRFSNGGDTNTGS
jgi:predicted 2-oxoglutarate/Fe(II)-dependent dioxygenase YbiX